MVCHFFNVIRLKAFSILNLLIYTCQKKPSTQNTKKKRNTKMPTMSLEEFSQMPSKQKLPSEQSIKSATLNGNVLYNYIILYYV